MSPEDIRIAVVPIGDVAEITQHTIVAHIHGFLNLNADTLLPLQPPSYAFDKRRMQYDAARILNRLESTFFEVYTKIIAILEFDIFVPIFTHVFGEAKQGGKCAIVSTHRLKTQSRSASNSTGALLLERVAKVTLHEVGHLFNLYHCRQQGCLMHFSGGLSDLDETPLYFCEYCSRYLQTALGHGRRYLE